MKFNLLSANLTKWSNTQTIRRQMLKNCLSVFDIFVGFELKGLSAFKGFRAPNRKLLP